MTQDLSERRALAVARMSASALRNAPQPDRNGELRERIRALAHRHRRYGVGMIHLKLRQAGMLLNYTVRSMTAAPPKVLHAIHPSA